MAAEGIKRSGCATPNDKTQFDRLVANARSEEEERRKDEKRIALERNEKARKEKQESFKKSLDRKKDEIEGGRERSASERDSQQRRLIKQNQEKGTVEEAKTAAQMMKELRADPLLPKLNRPGSNVVSQRLLQQPKRRLKSPKKALGTKIVVKPETRTLTRPVTKPQTFVTGPEQSTPVVQQQPRAQPPIALQPKAQQLQRKPQHTATKVASPASGQLSDSVTAKPLNPTVARELQPYIALAEDAYNQNSTSRTRPTGYRMIDQAEKGEFFARTYISTDNGGKNVVISYRGSDNILKDTAQANLPALRGDNDVKQYKLALEYARQIQLKYPSHNITLTGHSLGGGLASYTGNTLGLDTYTFNSARNPYSTGTQQSSTHKQINVYSIGDAVGDPDARIGSQLGTGTGPSPNFFGRGSLPGSTYFVNVPELTGANDWNALKWTHGRQNLSAAIGEMILKSEINRRR